MSCFTNKNTFIRLKDFNTASLDGKDKRGHTVSFASSNFFQNKPRTPMDDLESLVFSLWNAAGDKGGFFSRFEGKTLAECKKNKTAKEIMEVSFK